MAEPQVHRLELPFFAADRTGLQHSARERRRQGTRHKIRVIRSITQVTQRKGGKTMANLAIIVSNDRPIREERYPRTWLLYRDKDTIEIHVSFSLLESKYCVYCASQNEHPKLQRGGFNCADGVVQAESDFR